MANCTLSTDENGRELVMHGTTAFPVAGYQNPDHKMDIPWHWHEEWEAMVIIRGSCTVASGSRRITLQAGQGLFINSGVLHGCWDLERSGCIFHSLVFHPRLVGGCTDSVYHLDYVQPILDNPELDILLLTADSGWGESALRALEAAWQAFFKKNLRYVFSVREDLTLLTALVAENLPHNYSTPGNRTLRDAQRIKTMLSFIHSSYADPIRTADIASSASISESECLRCFHATIGTTPIQYLKQYRIRQAARMLLETSDTISGIAERCGFQDMSYFTRSFRDQMGYVPSTYRKTR